MSICSYMIYCRLTTAESLQQSIYEKLARRCLLHETFVLIKLHCLNEITPPGDEMLFKCNFNN